MSCTDIVDIEINSIKYIFTQMSISLSIGMINLNEVS